MMEDVFDPSAPRWLISQCNLVTDAFECLKSQFVQDVTEYLLVLSS